MVLDSGLARHGDSSHDSNDFTKMPNRLLYIGKTS